MWVFVSVGCLGLGHFLLGWFVGVEFPDDGLALLLLVAVEDLVDAVLGLLAAVGQPQVHVGDRCVLVHALLQLLAAVLNTN